MFVLYDTKSSEFPPYYYNKSKPTLSFDFVVLRTLPSNYSYSHRDEFARSHIPELYLFSHGLIDLAKKVVSILHRNV